MSKKNAKVKSVDGQNLVDLTETKNPTMNDGPIEHSVDEETRMLEDDYKSDMTNQDSTDNQVLVEQKTRFQQIIGELAPFDALSAILEANLTQAETWSAIARLAEMNSDGWSQIKDLSILSDEEIVRRLKNIASKKSIAKKAGDEGAVAILDKQGAELVKYRVNMPASREYTSVSANMTDEDIAKMTYEDLVKAIRNVQSKKCAAKKVLDLEKLAELTALEEKLIAARSKAPSAGKKANELSEKIKQTIAELEKVEPQTDLIKQQIAMLKVLL